MKSAPAMPERPCPLIDPGDRLYSQEKMLGSSYLPIQPPMFLDVISKFLRFGINGL